MWSHQNIKRIRLNMSYRVKVKLFFYSVNPRRARRRRGSGGSNEPPLKINNGGRKAFK